MAKKVKFKEYQKKHIDGFVENIICAYFDVTSEVKDMLGAGVKKAILIECGVKPRASALGI